MVLPKEDSKNAQMDLGTRTGSYGVEGSNRTLSSHTRSLLSVLFGTAEDSWAVLGLYMSHRRQNMMNGTAAVSSASVADLYGSSVSNNYCAVAIGALLIYDWLCSLEQEARLVWRSPRTSATFMYCFNRYMGILSCVVTTIPALPLSDKSCLRLVWTGFILELLVLPTPAFFSALRVYAITRQNKPLAGITLVLGLVPLIVNSSTMYSSTPANFPPPVNCSFTEDTSSTVMLVCVLISRSCLMLSELIVIAVTWTKLYASSCLIQGVIQGPTLHQVLLECGSVYFLLMASLNALHIILTATSEGFIVDMQSYASNFIDPIASILISRFLLNLRETQARAALYSQSASASMAFADPVSPELPSFVEAVAGPVHGPSEPLEDAGMQE